GTTSYIRSTASERSSQAELVGALTHETDHVRDVLLERNAEQRRALDEVLALHAARERLVLHPLLHGARLEIEHAPARPDQRGRGDEPGELVAREQRLLEQAVPADAGDLARVREDRAAHPLRVALLLQDFAALVRMVAERRPALVVEVVQEGGHAPLVFVPAELPRVAAHGRLHGQRVLEQTVALRVLRQEGP